MRRGEITRHPFDHRHRASAVPGRKEHLDELAALFAQNGVPARCQPGEDTLLLDAGVDLAKAREVLEEYKTAKGS